METFEEMEDEDGYMMLNCKNNFKYRQKTKGKNIVSLHSDSSLKLHYSLKEDNYI